MADYPLTQSGWEQIENASALWDYTQARIKTADPNKPIDIREIYQNGKQVANKEDLDANTAQINLNQTEIATNKSDITALDGEVNANASQIQINANSIANLDTRVTTNTNDIASLQSQVTALNASSLSDVASNNSLNGDGRAIDPLSLNLANSNTWTATQTFSKAKITNPFAENASGSTNKVTSLDQDGEITVSSDLTIDDLFTTKTKADANESSITALDSRVTTIEDNETNYAKLDQDNTFLGSVTSSYIKTINPVTVSDCDNVKNGFNFEFCEPSSSNRPNDNFNNLINLGVNYSRMTQITTNFDTKDLTVSIRTIDWNGNWKDWSNVLTAPLTGLPVGSGLPVLWDGTKLVVGS